jgi:hypothetical protein
MGSWEMMSNIFDARSILRKEIREGLFLEVIQMSILLSVFIQLLFSFYRKVLKTLRCVADGVAPAASGCSKR